MSFQNSSKAGTHKDTEDSIPETMRKQGLEARVGTTEGQNPARRSPGIPAAPGNRDVGRQAGPKSLQSRLWLLYPRAAVQSQICHLWESWRNWPSGILGTSTGRNSATKCRVPDQAKILVINTEELGGAPYKISARIIVSLLGFSHLTYV